MLTKNDLSQIKTAVRETIQPEIEVLKQSTKMDMQNLETRLTGDINGLEVNMKNLETRLTGDINGLEVNMKNLETRLTNDMKNMEIRLIERIDEAQMEIITTVDKHKADKKDVRILERRADRLEDDAGLPPYADQ